MYMSNKTDNNKKQIIQPIDFFYDTEYISHTANGITQLHNDLKYRFPCKLCKNNYVDTKLSIKDMHTPTFVIMRKFFCFTCWLKEINS
jgi:hypothetical protein